VESRERKLLSYGGENGKKERFQRKKGRGESNGKIGIQKEGRELGSFGGKIHKVVDRKGKGEAVKRQKQKRDWEERFFQRG
jgi:hypothetical protein